MNTTALLIWIVLAGLFAAWIALLLCTVVRHERPYIFTRSRCDERQQAVRGAAFMYGFLTIMAFLTAWLFVEAAGVTLFTPVAGAAIGLVAGCMPFITICILSDAFFQLGESIGVKVVILNLPLIGWIIRMTEVDWHAIVQNGVVTQEIFMPLICALYLYMDVLLWIRFVREKKLRE